MPAADSKHRENDSEPEPARGEGPDRDRERGEKDKGGKHNKSSAKPKDLSHVPCKFFKVGSCTAGSSCPFSHQTLEPGQHKETCAWFVKGNCKFGHKCALAHILPGQSMSMDRKNKKAAQLAANAGGGGGREGSRSSRGNKASSQQGGAAGGPGAQSRNALFSGSTAPTRSLAANARNPIPMPLKATLSPSAPAPPVKDTDFASFGLPDESNKLASAPAQGKAAASPSADDHQPAPTDGSKAESGQDQPLAEGASQSPLPTSTPSAPRRISDASPSTDLGPIGSPPRASSSSSRPARVNGFSPGTSPQGPGISSSPFSAPGTQSVFAIPQRDDGSSDFKNRSALSASLGAMTWGSERVTTSRRTIAMEEVVVEDEDLEDFLPSSLTDLLTPEERSRRMSRTNSRPNVHGADRDHSAQRSGSEAHHRYSRSVPAPSLLQDIRSIWSDAGAVPVGSPDASTLSTSHLGGGLGNGTPSSFTSNSGLGSRVDDMLNPSNASAAFLPGLHHYINAKNQQRPNMVSGLSSMYPGSGTNVPTLSTSASAYGPELNGVAMSPPRTSVYGNRPPFEQLPSDGYLPHPSGLRPGARPIPAGDAYGNPTLDEHRSALSPSARALQAHAPGQSLPQGLAAGYSRIHALPPPVIPSPSTSSVLSRTPLGGGFSPAAKTFGHGHSTSGDWASMSPTASSLLDQINGHGAHQQQAQANLGQGAPPGTSLGGLETMFSRASYSAAASRGPVNAAPPGLGARVPSGGRAHPQGSLSPLSGPVLTGEDDDLFAME
ncbi:Protein cps3 [Trametes pubescens]|uniref:Protein cps3 n=1 Tax=Trametes pubescens TaxID=154538 RepID=A0A1M2V2K6_TRAPU|nr:Protein cps3 [Trametes pubescens]